MRRTVISGLSKLVIGLGFLVCNPVHLCAQDGGWNWTDAAEVSFVWTAGNSSTNTLGLKNVLEGEGGKSKLSIEVGGIRTSSTVKSRVANGTPSDFTITTSSESELTAESYTAKIRYDLRVNVQAYWFAGSDWGRNTFSGVDGRFTFVSGLGNQWANSARFKLGTDLGITYTVQNNVVADRTASFGGLRFTYNLQRSVTANSTLNSKLILDENLENTKDLRGDWTNSLTVAMSSRLALKTSAQLLFDNQPSSIVVPLLEEGTNLGKTVVTPLDKVDSVFTVALVINF